jgi:rhodanese-related sulfurtransferase
MEDLTVTALISKDELKRKLGSVELVEALPAEAYERSHLPGAKNIPVGEIRELAPKLLLNKEGEIVVYCANPT